MATKNTNRQYEAPSVGKLIKSTILAIVIAAVILVIVVLPAEYGIDPTGIGSLIGLQRMGEIKASLAQEAAADNTLESARLSLDMETQLRDPQPAVEAKAEGQKEDTQAKEFSFSLSPNEGTEIKLTMAKGAQVNYEWWTDGGRANFDAHADSKVLQIKYHNYEKGAKERAEGVLEAAFDGNHGWFWRNRTSEPMTISLKVSGEYTDVVRM